MAGVVAAAPPPRRGAPPLPWHAQMQECLQEAERAVGALLAVCTEPAARAALEVRSAALAGARPHAAA